MPLDGEFKQHLHELMVEASLSIQNEEADYKRQLVWKAQQTHNAAAMPIAYKDAAIHAFRGRVERIVAKWLNALNECQITVDDGVEKEMLQSVATLTSATHSLSFPPGLRGQNLQAVQAEYVREQQRVGNELYRKAANQLRELKLKTKHSPSQNATVMNVYQMPFSQGRIYSNSTDNSVNNVELSLANLEAIERLSVGNDDLEKAAQELRAAYPVKTTMLERAQKWMVLATSVEGLMEKAHQHYSLRRDRNSSVEITETTG